MGRPASTYPTPLAKTGEIKPRVLLFDADGQTLGRLASRIAIILRGKHRATYTPHTRTGDFVIVVNAEKVKVTGRKAEQKVYHHYTGYPGGLRSEKLTALLKRKPEELVRKAVWGMLPKGSLGRDLYRALRVYKGPEHPHAGQQPERVDARVLALK